MRLQRSALWRGSPPFNVEPRCCQLDCEREFAGRFHRTRAQVKGFVASVECRDVVSEPLTPHCRRRVVHTRLGKGARRVVHSTWGGGAARCALDGEVGGGGADCTLDQKVGGAFCTLDGGGGGQESAGEGE